ncbi:MAG: tRNA (adenosine(37)-N6)-threonylcarbamoyltransferase complex ATPase subunit type 1 TsaE [Anaerolineae bacterium]
MVGDSFSPHVMEVKSLDLCTTSPFETRQLGAAVARRLESGDVVALIGDLGAGKTHFVQGLARGLGVKESVHSPTFILANEYRSGRMPLYHVDAYRVAGAGEALGFGFDDYLNGTGVTVIEWADRIRAALPPEYLTLEFHHAGETVRAITITARGDHFCRLLDDLVLAYAPPPTPNSPCEAQARRVKGE